MPTKASDLYYYVNHPSSTKQALACDKYIRHHSSQFLNDMQELNSTYQKKQYDKSLEILERYGINKNKDNLLKNKFVSTALNCSAIYKFSGDVNYYREFMTTMTLFISTISNTVVNSLPHYNEANDLYEKTIDYFNVILSSTNKTANK